MNDINQELRRLYEKLKVNTIFENKKKLINNSLFLTLMFDVKSNVRLRLFSESVVPKHQISPETFNLMLTKDYIFNTGDIDNYTITAKGIWEYESNSGAIDLEKLLKFLDDKQILKLFSSKELSDREKIQIFSMITLRAFSIDSKINLKTTEVSMGALEEVLRESYAMLKKLNLIKKTSKEIFGKSDNENPLYNFIRHSDNLPKVTKAIFTSTGSQEYYLNLYKNGQFSTEDLTYLLWTILKSNNSLSILDAEGISNFCNKISYDKSIYIFNPEKHIFANPDFDAILHNSMINAIENINE